FFCWSRRPPLSPLFPYTTLFRSILLARGELAVLACVTLHVDLVRDPEVGRELLVGPVERRVRDVVPVEDAGGGAVDDPGGAVGMARLEDADALQWRGGARRCRCDVVHWGLPPATFRAGVFLEESPPGSGGRAEGAGVWGQ